MAASSIVSVLRRARGLSQVELARRCKVYQDRISRIERGRTDLLRCEGRLIARLATELGVTTDDLIGETPSPVHAE